MKKNTFKVFVFSFMALSSVITYGQNQIKKGELKHFGKTIAPTQELTPSGHVRCHSTEYEAYLKTQFPKRATTAEFEAWLAPKIAQIKADKAAGRSVQTIYNIPVVIHIVHDGDALGTGENITDAQAISQINVMNQDYRRMSGTNGGANTTLAAVDCEINFCLAKTDPNGNLTTGVVRHVITPYSNNVVNGSGGPDWETTSDVQTMKAATIWDPTKYLNMWTIRPGGNSLQSGGLDGLLGYAQFPDNTPNLGGLSATGGLASTDGVVAGYNAMGTIAEDDGSFILNGSYNLGRTMTHEVGHWLGLRHIWGDGGCDVDDYCNDTPAAAAANYDCVTVDSCPSAAGSDQYQNYMDYSYDYCMDTFTADQKLRIQAVMASSPRRSTLNTSTACEVPAPYIQFRNTTGSLNEGTSCNYTDYTFPVEILKAASETAVVTFNVTGGTATQNTDFTIVNPTISFPAGLISTQNLTVRVFNDGLVEGNETLEITLGLNTNGGNSVLNDVAKAITITIVDNEFAPNPLQTLTLLNETFETTAIGWTVLDADGDGENWGRLNTALDGYGTSPNTISGACAFSEKRLTYLGGTGNATPNNYFISPQIAIPAGASAVNLSFIIGAFDDTGVTRSAGNFSVYFTTNISSEASITSGTLIQSNLTITEATTLLKNYNLVALSGQTGYFVFRHSNLTSSVALLLLDTVLLEAVVNSSIQTEINTSTAYQAAIPGAGVFHPKDSSTGKLMASVTTDVFNYGCTSVSVNRSQTSAGAAAVNYGSNTANNLKVMAKTFLVTPTTNNASGNTTLKFYFTEAEIAAWETATGNNRSALKVFKNGSSTILATTIGAFGTNVTLSAIATNGISGTYYFGIEASLETSSFEIVNAISIYPNPTSDELNINLPGSFENSKYTVFNNIGQMIKTKVIASQSDLKLNTSELSSGVYFIKIDKEGSTKTLKFIKN